jgi:hypothetical protein
MLTDTSLLPAPTRAFQLALLIHRLAEGRDLTFFDRATRP